MNIRPKYIGWYNPTYAQKKHSVNSQFYRVTTPIAIVFMAETPTFKKKKRVVNSFGDFLCHRRFLPRGRGWDHTVVADQNRSRDGFQAMSVSPVHQIRLDRDNGPNGVGDQNQISWETLAFTMPYHAKNR